MSVSTMRTILAVRGKPLASVLAAGLLVGVLGYPDARAQDRTEHIFDDWRVVCVESGEPESENRCHMLQTLILNETGREVFRWMIVSNEENQLTSVFSAPLGVSLRPGVELSLAGTEAGTDPVSVAYSFCNQRWCHARQPMTDELVSQLESGEGEPVEVVYTNRRGQGLRMQATMRGFNEALAFMQQENAS